MLASLMINNVVLIDRLAIQFESGLCALTGETGAGKSILLDSLGLALGARSESGLVRKEADQAIVAAEFDIASDHPAFTILKEQGLDIESPLILRRSVNADGKSRAFINDHPVSVALLKQIGEMLVEIHGQFDTQTLLNPRTHRGLLDDYAGNSKDLVSLENLWAGWRSALDALELRKAEMERARAEEDYLRAALEQLDELDPQEGEEEKLTLLRSRLMRREQNIENYNSAYAASDDAIAAMNMVWKSLERAGEGGTDVAKALDRAMVEIQEVSAGVEAMIASLDESEYSLAEIDDRLFALKAQARKHACTIEELPIKREEMARLLSSIETQGDTLATLEKDVAQAKKTYTALAKTISEKRKAAASRLDKLVAKELIPLKLEKARFETAIDDVGEDDWGAHGMDRVQFQVATNPGVGSSRVDLQACKLEYSIVSPK